MVFAAAVVFAAYTVLSVRQIHHYGPLLFTSYAMIAATAATSVHGFSLHGVGVFIHAEKVYLLIFLMAVFSTVLPLLLMAEGVKRLGASGTSIVSTTGPPVTLMLAFFVLGESFGILQAVGSVLILVGVYFVSRVQSSKN
jgi:drug/metabolite transporter (DMT)-like permease